MDQNSEMIIHQERVDQTIGQTENNSESVQYEKSYTYMVRCSDGTLYTGWTNDLKKRIRVHNSGKGAKYTRCRLPVQLVYYEEFSTKREAMSREVHIKQLNKVEKEALAASFSVDECFIC